MKNNLTKITPFTTPTRENGLHHIRYAGGLCDRHVERSNKAPRSITRLIAWDEQRADLRVVESGEEVEQHNVVMKETYNHVGRGIGLGMVGVEHHYLLKSIEWLDHWYNDLLVGEDVRFDKTHFGRIGVGEEKPYPDRATLDSLVASSLIPHKKYARQTQGTLLRKPVPTS